MAGPRASRCDTPMRRPTPNPRMQLVPMQVPFLPFQFDEAVRPASSGPQIFADGSAARIACAAGRKISFTN